VGRAVRQRGFTIVELAIVMLVISVLLGIGAPSFGVWLANQRLRTTAESILHGLNIARAEAIRRNARVLFEMNDADGRSGWRVCPVVPGTLACDEAVTPVMVRDGGEESGNVRVGASTDADLLLPGALSNALMPAAGMPAVVMFDGLGRLASPVGWLNTVRFDSRDTMIDAAVERRLVVAVSPGGAARICDPRLPTGNPAAC
jgi:type IV fimbrial biogenesis protein FimT